MSDGEDNGSYGFGGVNDGDDNGYGFGSVSDGEDNGRYGSIGVKH